MVYFFFNVSFLDHAVGLGKSFEETETISFLFQYLAKVSHFYSFQSPQTTSQPNKNLWLQTPDLERVLLLMEDWSIIGNPERSSHGSMHYFPGNKNSPTVLVFVADKTTFRKNFYVCEMNSENEVRIIVLGVIPKILHLNVA